ncbi:hypothetical protein [Rhizorhabdus dicambivorans]
MKVNAAFRGDHHEKGPPNLGQGAIPIGYASWPLNDPIMSGAPTQSYERLSLQKLLNEPSGRYAERFGQLFQYHHRRIPRPAFNVADIGAVNIGLMGESLLAPALLLAEGADVLPEALAYIHSSLKTRLSTIDLQTISDNLVDWRRFPSIGYVTHRRYSLTVRRLERT